MDEHLRSENRTLLSTIAAFIIFPYIWIGLFLMLSLMFGANFFGRGFGGGIVAGLLCIGLLNPLVPGAIANYVARPIFSNLLGREMVAPPGCIAGLIGVVAMGLGILFFLARDLNTSLIFFLLTPIVGAALAAAVTFFGRGGGVARRGSAPLVSRSDQPSLPDPENRRRLPEGRRAERPSFAAGRTSQPRIAPPPNRNSSRRNDGKRPPPPPRRR
ncbi:MAG: hypothetical protein KC441_02985 [Anaerolineales bacterium]|nr:hypothetical protein [Anaerolineales bacterium]